MQKRLSILLLLLLGSNVWGQEIEKPDRPPIEGLFLINVLSPFREVGELHVAYEKALNRKRRSSIMFEGFAGISKKNLIENANLLQENQRITNFDPSKRNFGLGVHLRKYGFDAPYSWYIGLLASFKRYHYSVAEGYCIGGGPDLCDLSVRFLTVKSEIVRFGGDFGFNAKLSQTVFLNVSTEFGAQGIFNNRSIPYSFTQGLSPFIRNFRRSQREMINDPGGDPGLEGFRAFMGIKLSIGFAIR